MLLILGGNSKHHPKDNLHKLIVAVGDKVFSRKSKRDSDVSQIINALVFHASPVSDKHFCIDDIIYEDWFYCQTERVQKGKVWMTPPTWLNNCVMYFVSSWQVNVIPGEYFELTMDNLWEIRCCFMFDHSHLYGKRKTFLFSFFMVEQLREKSEKTRLPVSLWNVFMINFNVQQG